MRNIKSILTMVLCLVMVALMVVSCGSKNTPPVEEGTEETTTNNGDVVVPQITYKQAEYNTTTSVMPSNWNELTYQDNNDTQILSYIGSAFFDYDYKFENDVKYLADGSINKAGIVAGAYTTNYSAATKLEDVTALVDAKWGYTDAQKAEGGYAWKITLRDDLKWDDGTPITAADFVWTMQQTLDPAFMNYRANTYYDTLMIKNAKNYFYQNQEGTYEPVGSKYASNQAAIDAGVTLYIDVYGAWGAEGYLSATGEACPQWLAITDETEYNNAEGSDPTSGKIVYETYMSMPQYAPEFEVGGGYASLMAIFVENANRDVAWDTVGIYAEGNAIVVCLDKTYSFLKKDADGNVVVGNGDNRDRRRQHRGHVLHGPHRRDHGGAPKNKQGAGGSNKPGDEDGDRSIFCFLR